MKQYESYKDSGVQWIGQIPSHWQMTKSKHIFSLITDNVCDKSLPKVALENIESGTGKYIETSSDFMGEGIEFQVNDILFGKLRPYLAKVYKADFRGQSVGDIYVFRPKENQDAGFLKYLMLSRPFISVVDGSTYGAKMPRANWDFISQMLLPTPNLDEQRIIASYLDHKVGQIDAVIVEKEAMVSDLTAYRSAVISEAVTRGLDKSAPLRDSGIDWIGKIPKHWQVVNLKRVSKIQTGNTPSTSIEKYWSNPTEDWFTPSDFDEMNIRLSHSARKLNECAFDEMACRVFNPGTVLVVGIGATLGKVGLVLSRCSSNQQINAVEFFEIINPLYGAYYLSSKTEVMKAQANSSTLPILTQTAMGELMFVLPPIEEQDQIVSHIESFTASITTTLAELQAEIADLQSYKSAIITEAVTGKVDLRDWKPKTVTA